MSEGLWQIERVVGNNVVLTIDPDRRTEYVLFGKGIGFGVRAGATMPKEDNRIEKRYRLDEELPLSHYRALADEIDADCLRISEHMIERIRERIGAPIQPKVYFALPNHIQFAVYRLRNGMDIVYPFLEETKRDYPVEFEIAEEAAALIAEQFQLAIPEDEVGFLTLHVRAAQRPADGSLDQPTEDIEVPKQSHSIQHATEPKE